MKSAGAEPGNGRTAVENEIRSGDLPAIGPCVAAVTSPSYRNGLNKIGVRSQLFRRFRPRLTTEFSRLTDRAVNTTSNHQ